MSRKSVLVSLIALSALVLMAMSTGCTAEGTSSGEQSCAVSTDCSGDEVCNDGVCEQPAAECEEDAECTDIPAATCDGDELLTYTGVCGGDEPGCNYAVKETETCATGCSDGQCNPDACEGVTCDDPPEPTCTDADTLEVYTGNSDCADGDCSYETETSGCVHGCADGACNEGACDAAVCDEPPEPSCDGNTYVDYAEDGHCYEEDGAATCGYDKNFTNCDYVGGTCDVDAGGCVDAITQVGGAVIVEYMVNPTGLSDSDAEWFEVVNTSGSAIDLNGWRIESGTSGDTIEEHVIEDAPAFPDGARLVFARGDDPAGDASVSPAYVYGFDISMNNMSDWIQLVRPGSDEDEIVDRVFWEEGAIIAGKSRKLDPQADVSASANDDVSNWCPELDEGFGSEANFGTPGSTNPACTAAPCDTYVCEQPEDYCNYDGDAVEYTVEDPTCEVSRFQNPYCDFEPVTVECTTEQYCVTGVCEDVSHDLPAAGDVIFTEFMGDPEAIGDTSGEYIELYNTTDQELALFTLTIHDDEEGSMNDSFVIDDPTATIAAGGYAVLATDTDETVNGGIEDAYLLADSPLKNSPGADGLTITLVRQDGVVVDEAYYGEPTEGVAQQLSSDAYDGVADADAANDDATNFCDATEASAGYTSGDLGSPGAANEVCGQ
ncbi:MAG: lamin tail domain-containing protein [Persicimonas sp.]